MASKPPYKFIDLFAGLGGFHVAFARKKRATCVYASEWDPAARKTYEHNFRKSDPHLFADGHRLFVGDIESVDPWAKFDPSDPTKGIPGFDILCGGFPCQPFSQAGHKKGFSDTRGTLFFRIQEILRAKRPRAFFLENVRGLLTHGGPSDVDPSRMGKTMETIQRNLFSNEEGCLGYHRPIGPDGKPQGYFLVKASDYGVPQHRPRVFIIGFRDEEDAKSFRIPSPQKLSPRLLGDILSEGNHAAEDDAPVDVFFDKRCSKPRSIGFTLRCGGKGSPILDRRNWEHYYVRKRNSPAKREAEVRKITQKQGLRLHGFPTWYNFPDKGEFKIGLAARMKQLGNSVAVTAVQAWGEAIMDALDK
jgi:DNA (cytosine-5)-methyltransferase 1